MAVNGAVHQNNTYTYGVEHRLSTVSSNGALQSTYSYDANGNRISNVLSNGVRTDYTFNLANLVTNLTNRRGDTVLSSFEYTYYLDGNTSRLVEVMDGETRTITYNYDLARRLVREQTTGADARIESYTFDNRGNRASRAVIGSENYTVTYAYDLNNRLLRSNCLGDGSDTSVFTYDHNGNQLTMINNEQAEMRTYNAFNQPVSVDIDRFAEDLSKITNAAINVTAPVTGNVRNTNATGTGSFIINPVTWSPNDVIFAANTRYTATVTLTANTGYTFDGLETATINGNPATITNNTGSTVTLSYQFFETDTSTSLTPMISAGSNHNAVLRYSFCL